MTVAIINYGMGNLRSVEKAFAYLGFEAEITEDPNIILKAQKVVLPGVGAFGEGMKELHSRKLLSVIMDVVRQNKPFLGICLGLQLLFDSSEEAPRVQGLGILPGTVKRFPYGLTVPHIGWNQIHIRRDSPLLKNIPDNSYFYFVHSYYVVPADDSVVAATTDYNIEFASLISWNNVFGTQFHPEKSQRLGLEMLRNFASL